MGFQNRYVGNNGDGILVSVDSAKVSRGIIKVTMSRTGKADISMSNDPFWQWLDNLIWNTYGTEFEVDALTGSPTANDNEVTVRYLHHAE